MTNVAYPMCREYFHASVAATDVGCVNLTAYISTVIYQTGKLLDWKYKISDNDGSSYSKEGYKFVLWLPSLISTSIGMIMIMIADDSPGPGKLSLCCSCKKDQIKGNVMKNYINEPLFSDDKYHE